MKHVYVVLFVMTLVACKPSAHQSQTVESNPLSSRDPKLTLSPDERYGVLFDSVQLSGIFSDAKTFVDCIPITTTDSLLAAFETERQKPDFNLQNFVNQYFILPKSPSDSFRTDVSKSVEEHIRTLWTVWARPTDTADFGTKIPLPKPYILTNGQSRELHYWDSYFTMLGLQADGRVDLVENMVDNFAHLINAHGFIPSGNRTYYLSRSQPPFFSCMVQMLAQMKKSDEVYKKYLPQLEKEYAFWMDGKLNDPGKDASSKRRVLHVDGNTLNRFYDDSDKPRPEHYKSDKDTARQTGQELKMIYRHLRASAESGWDYSSRWFSDGKNFKTLYTTDLAPLDLNALIYNLEMVIMKGKIVEKKYNEASELEKKASKRREAMMRYCWNDEKGMFFDFNFQRYKRAEVMSLATMYPLFFKMVTKRQADKVAQAIRIHFLKPGGVVTTTNKTGHKWDAPYGYAPLQWITIQGLRNYGQNELANDIKARWMDLNTKIYQKTGKMLEKYNVEDLSIESDSSDYSAQDGFGWTNGVLQKLLKEK